MVNRYKAILAVLVLFVVFLASPIMGWAANTAKAPKPLIFDEAGLLTKAEADELNALANQYGALRDTDIIIYTSKNAGNADVMIMTEDFYDQHAPGYDKPHGNAVILTMDMKNRELYLAGFYKGKEYLDDKRLDQIRSKISPDLSNGNYKSAFRKYIQTAYDYMGFRPGVNPENPLFNNWLLLGVSVVIGGIIVGVMAYRSGGRVTVDRRTYEDSANSSIVDKRDQYLRTTVTKQKIVKSNGGGSRGGGGGGTTGGGHSHSGSRGSF